MQTKPLLSIVIPCYNSYNLMGRAFESFTSMHSNKFEVIVIDDCSADDSYEQLNQFSKNADFPMRVYKNAENTGPGPSRNLGIQKAEGQYITFLDADDFLDVSFIEKILPLMKQNYDCIIFDFNEVQNEKITPFKMVYGNFTDGPLSAENALVYTRGATWGKIYKTNILRENELGFLSLKRNEDLALTKSALGAAGSIYYIHEKLYNYVIHENSLMHDPSLTDPQNSHKAFAYIKEHIETKYPEETEAIFIHEYLYSTGLTNLSRMNRKNWKKYISDTVGMYPCCIRNKYLNGFPFHVKAVVALMAHQCWAMLKILAWIKSKI